MLVSLNIYIYWIQCFNSTKRTIASIVPTIPHVDHHYYYFLLLQVRSCVYIVKFFLQITTIFLLYSIILLYYIFNLIYNLRIHNNKKKSVNPIYLNYNLTILNHH